MQITYTPEADGREAYQIDSDSGNTYRVTFCGSGDGDPDYCALWNCDCPAGRRGRRCKHVAAVIEAADDTPIAAGTIIFPTED